MRLMSSVLAAMLAASTFWPFPATAAELVMLERPGCVWCERFDAEIAPVWPKTEEGSRAPLRRVDVTAPWPEDLAHLTKERFTPTFILVEEGREVGRLRGYAGEEFFWYRIGELLAKLPAAAGHPE